MYVRYGHGEMVERERKEAIEMNRKHEAERGEERRRWFWTRLIVTVVAPLALMAVFGLFAATSGFAQEAGAEADLQEISAERAGVIKFGLIAAAGAFGFGALGAGFAIAHVGAAAMGAIGERPEVAGQALIFIALAEGLVVFGFITALMILGQV
jgi:V/A-type H+-transporting ATPase subunit K